MAVTLYNEHFVVSSATLHSPDERWIPVVIIGWRVGTQYHFHDINRLPNRFDDKQEAENFGTEAAKTWIDKRLSAARGRYSAALPLLF
jgi:hypothetical protein